MGRLLEEKKKRPLLVATVAMAVHWNADPKCTAVQWTATRPLLNLFRGRTDGFLAQT
jgi:hypothetical protein